MEKAAKGYGNDKNHLISTILITLILLIIPAYPALSEGEDKEFYNDKTYVKMNLSISSGLGIEQTSDAYYIDYIMINMLFFPRDTFMQKVNSLSTNPPAEIKDISLHYEWTDIPAQEIKFGYESDIEVWNRMVKIRKKIEYPLKENLSAELYNYTLSTRHIDVHDPDIVNLASDLAAGEDDLYVITHKLAAWTKENIEYNLSTMTATISQSASWTLKNREGVCDELTSLFIAMARALGIPARFIAGIAHTNSELFEQRWGPHGWAEVYFPGEGWVPFDPTYGEYGFIGPAHILLKYSYDPDDTTIKYEWKAKNIDIKTRELEVSVDAYETGERLDPLIRLEGDVLKKAIGFGSYQLVELTILNLKDYYIATNLYISKPKEVELVSNNEISVLLRPRENKTIYWIMRVKEELNPNVIYRFPIRIISSRNATAELEFSSYIEYSIISLERIEQIIEQTREEEAKNYSTDVEFECTTDKEYFYAYEDIDIRCTLKNAGNTHLFNVSICMDKECSDHDIGINQEAETAFQMKANMTGYQQTSVTAGNKDFSKLAIIEVEIMDKPSIKIKNISYPDSIGYNKNFTLSFTLLKESKSNPVNVSLKLDVEGTKKSWTIEEMETDQEFIINMNSRILGMGNNKISITADYYDKNNTDYSTEENISMSLADVSLLQKILIKLNSMTKRLNSYIESF